MAEKTEMKVQNLENLLRLKSLILKATEIDKLLSGVCNAITQFQVYDVSWAILVDSDNNIKEKYSSHKDLNSKVEYLCWKDALETNILYSHPRDSTRCNKCKLFNNIDATLLSKRIEYNGVVYGVFSTSIKNCLIDRKVELQFIDLVDDISAAIFSIRLKEKNERVQLKLTESQHMYRKLLETSSLPLGIMNLDYEITYMSNSLKELFGYSLDDKSLIRENVKGTSFLSQGFGNKAIDSLKEVLAKDIVNTGDVVFETQDGRQLQVRLKMSLMRNAGGNPSGYMIVFHDLSSEIKTAEELRISEEKFRLLFMKAPNGMSLLSPSGVIIECNEHDAHLLQMKRSDLIGSHIIEFLTPEFRKSFPQNFEEFKSSGSKSIVVKLNRKDGSVISVERSVTALNDKDGSLKGIVVHSRNITEELKVQEKVKVLLAAIEQSSSVFTVTDIEGNISYVNKRFTELTGYSVDEVIGNNPRILKSGLLSDVVYKEMWEDLMKGGIWKGELCNKKKNGELYWEYASMSAVRNLDGEITSLLKVAEDITQRRKSEQELKEATVRYHNIFDLVPNPILLHQNGFIVDVNQAAFAFSKVKKMKDLVGMSVMTFVHSSSYEFIKKRVEHMLLKGGSLPLTKANFVNIHGERREVETITKEVSFKGEQAYMVVFEDVTEKNLAEQKLLESEKKFKDIFNLHPDPVSIADMDSGLMYEANDSFLKILGMRRDQVIGVSSLDIDLYKDLKIREYIINQIKIHGRIDNQEVSFVVNGQDLTALVSGARFGGTDSNKVLFVARDISNLKKAQEELNELNVRYRNIFNMAPNPIIIHIDGKMVDINRAALLFAGVKSQKKLLGKDIMSFVHESSRKEILRQILYLNKDAKILPFDATFITSKGEKRDVRTASNIISFGGKQAYMVFFEDITDRKQAMQKLVDSEKRFRQFFNLIPDPVLITNITDGAFIEFNRAAMELTGRSYKHFVGKNAIDYGLFSDIDHRIELISEFKEKGGLYDEEVDLVINDKTYTMIVSASVIEPSEEQNVLWIAHDITQRKAMEHDLVKARNRAEANEKLKSSFLSNISHEIRTPMNAILGFSDLLRDSEVETKYRNQYIDIIQQRGHDLLKMISDIMDISKIESGSLELNNRAVRIKNIIQEIVVKSKEKLLKMPSKSIVIDYVCKIGDEQLVSGDKYRISQVLHNLMDNALKFTQQGTISFRCWKENDYILFEVEDTGCGIAKDKIDQAFERFVQVHNIKDVSIGGAGLGLSISKSLLSLMNGKIWIDSELDHGTKVNFSLKVYDGGDMVYAKEKKELDIVYDWSGKTLLVAEDEPSNQMFIRVILEKTKANIIMANNGKEAVQLFDANKEVVDLVLVDIKMPEMNGYEVTQIIKKQMPDIPIIALTANAMNNDREEALKNGCDDYLSKPIAKELLYSTLDRYLQ